ncbi:very short patch repair endonuclease [Pantoea sp. A4]|uniref:very short patch repair endonuclease n=1 Tax=Pantoea sp. A4 TaxID=1225184 RepID=UPI00035CCA7C|nr:DNA mismatch endonuclease Vsr [Pantoea sp. A4]
MADVHSRDIRSKNMRAIRQQDTVIEQRVAALLSNAGLSWRAQDKTLPGRPDFVLHSHQAIIFVHGCFWHRHHCYLFKLPETRTGFWAGKINSNVERDKRYIQQLEEKHWKVLVIWECALRGKLHLSDPQLHDRIEEWLLDIPYSAEIDANGIRRYQPD